MRLFLRKTALWHRVRALRYGEDISNLPSAIESLQRFQTLSRVSEKPSSSKAGLPDLEELDLDGGFTWADSSTTAITTMEEAASLLSLDELKLVSREAKVSGRNKAELLRALAKMSKSQSALCWRDSKELESKSPHTPKFNKSNGLATEGLEVTPEQYFYQKIMTILGPCIRLSQPILRLFERVHLVFYRSTEWTDKSLTTVILARISRQRFPRYIVCRTANVFSSRSDLLEYESALKQQYRLVQILEKNGRLSDSEQEESLTILEQVYPRWRRLVEVEEKREASIIEGERGAYLRRFSPAWVYTRIIHKILSVLGRRKDYDREYSIITELLEQTLFHTARRGVWYQRKALLEEHYLFKIRPASGISDINSLKKYWKRMALQTCESGLRDKDCHVIYHYDLQKRIEKLEKNIRVPKREKHDFSHVLLREANHRKIEGVQVVRERASTKKSLSTGSLDGDGGQGKTIWINEYEDGEEVGVEALCLADYQSRGYKGYHAEGGIIRTLFAYLFRDILFMFVPNVFQTAYQTCPLDLHTDAFFHSRASEINRRLVEIENGAAGAIIQSVDAEERARGTCIIGLDWGYEVAHLLEIAECFQGAALAVVCRVLAQEYRVRGGGVPDLFLWRPDRREVVFAEVKSAHDRLSDTQRLWIHVLTGAGLEVDLCHVVAKEVRTR